jgi:hypothetical protein
MGKRKDIKKIAKLITIFLEVKLWKKNNRKIPHSIATAAAMKISAFPKKIKPKIMPKKEI